MSISVESLPDPLKKRSGWPWTEGGSNVQYSNHGAESLPKISIVTPSYNQGEFIEETIRSVLLQGYPNLEYFVIDGGSDDGTVEVIERYEEWIDYWVSEPDDGQAHAINKGLKRATGDIFAWINSDDFYVKDSFYTVVKAFKDSDADAISGGRLLVDRESNITGASIMPPFDPAKGGNTFPQDATFWRSHVHDGIGFLDESYQFAMDFEFFLRLYKEYNIQKKKILLSAFRCYDDNKSSNMFEEVGWPEVKKAWKKHLNHPVSNFKVNRSNKLTTLLFFLRYPRKIAFPYIKNKLDA